MPYLISTGKVTQNNCRRRCTSWRGSTSTARRSRSPRNTRTSRSALDAQPLKDAFDKKKAAGKEVKVAMTFPGGTHDLWIRYWLAAGGIDPDKDISTIVVPPPQMVANMKVGNMDASASASRGTSSSSTRTSASPRCTTGEIWNKHPEKALGMRADWVDKNPKAAKALLMAVMEAQQWCDKLENKQEMAEIVGQAPVVQRAGRRHHRPRQGRLSTTASAGKWSRTAPQHHEVLERPRLLSRSRATTSGSSPRTSAGASSSRRPTSRRSSTRSTARISGARRPRRSALPAADIPASTSRGKETFFDGKVFDPDNPLAYLKSLSIKRAEIG